MITYSSTKQGFLDDVLNNVYKDKILSSLVKETGYSVGFKEEKSWDSLRYMSEIMHDPNIPKDAGVALEYKINGTSNRIDFIITGTDENKKASVVIIELKQWSEGISTTEMDGVLKAEFYNNREVLHPSYQAWSYKTLLEDYNESVEINHIGLRPCAYLHNYLPDDIILNDLYKEHLKRAPAFLKNDAKKLQEFIKKYVKYGDNKETLYLIENGRIRPSKHLADSLASMLSNNQEFVLIDNQKIVYETALRLSDESGASLKNVYIVEGGPGTGKSVVAINLLSELINREKNTRYVTRNSAPREVFQNKLTGKFTKTRIANLFASSGSFCDAQKNTYDVLVVDEAHRLTERSGLFNNKGENQVKEIINASKFSIFFIDEDQQVTIRDIGTKGIIEHYAQKLNASVFHSKLESQFRCNGSDGYLAWIDETLQIRDTANDTLEGINYDFRIIDTPTELHQLIVDQNKINNKSRVVAGYCWKWISSKDSRLKDIVIGDYKATWNLKSDGQSWIIRENSVDQIGCIHTCQGLELDYVGVIIGPDIIIRDGKIITDRFKRASTDQSLKGINKFNEEDAKIIADKIIKNTYRTLMTRGMKGCYIYCTDEETQEYFKDKLFFNKNENELYVNKSDGTSINVDN